MENDFIKKPVTQEELEESLKRYEAEYDKARKFDLPPLSQGRLMITPFPIFF